RCHLLQVVGVDWSRGRSAVPVRGAPDAGALAGRAHPAGVLRHRLPRPGPVRRVAVPAHRGPAVPDAGPALVQDHAGPVAVGVVTGTILSFELGMLWPVWIQDFG